MSLNISSVSDPSKTRWQKIARRIRVPLGFAVAAVFLVFAAPTLRSLVWGLPFVLAGLWLRGYAAGYVKKNSELTQTGPYAHTRNPLYFGSFILAAGFAVASRSWWVALIAALMFFAIYIPVIRDEENFLRSHFPEFEEYARQVPRLFPRLRPHQSSATSFSWDLYWKHREYNAAMGAAFMIAAMAVKAVLGASH
jgi:protein-S-isoprenylcysteine O-methyltransferase Ste14